VSSGDRKYARFSAGTVALVAAAVGAVTGVFLSLNYAPTWSSAFASIANIQSNVGLGAFLRGLHRWAGTAALVLALFEAARMLRRGDYQRPHHRVWMLGVGLFVVLLGFGYTGYLLIGDERAYAGVLVLEGVARSAPWIGDALASIVLGGDTVSSATLTRLYTVHVVVLPFALLLLTAALVRTRGTTVTDELRRQVWSALGLLVVLAVLALAFPSKLGDAGGPGTEASSNAQPEWFFLWVNELLHQLNGQAFLVAGVLPLAVLGGALALPYIRKGRKTTGTRPELFVAAGVLTAIGILSIMATARAKPEADDEESKGTAVTPKAADNDIVPDPEFEETVQKTLRRFRCAKCHVIHGDPDGGEDGPPLPLGAEFAELYSRKYFAKKVSDPVAFWADTGMTYPKKRKPTPEEMEVLARYFYGD